RFWATTKLHHTLIRFKIDTKKSVLNLEDFREMLHVSPRIPNQPFADLPTEEEVLDFLSQEEGNESNDDSDDGSDKDSEETVKSGAGKDSDEDDDENDDDDDEEEETAKDDKETKETGKGGDEVRESEGESEEEEVSFDPIPKTPEDSEKESVDEEEQESRLSEEARIQEKEDTEELYRDVNINQGRGLQITQSVEDTHVILTPVNPDDPQESSSMSSFVSSMLNPLSDEGVESIFTTTSSQSVSLIPPTPIMTPSIIATITTLGEEPIPPPTIPSIILENLPTFNSAFRFEERLRVVAEHHEDEYTNLIFSWSLDDILNQDLFKNKIMYSAPFADILSINKSTSGENRVYDVTLGHWGNQCGGHDTFLSDLLLLVKGKPESVTDLKHVERTWAISTVKEKCNVCSFGYDGMVSQKLDPRLLPNLNESQRGKLSWRCFVKRNKRTLTCTPTNVAIVQLASSMLSLVKEIYETTTAIYDYFSSVGDVLLFGNREILKVGIDTEEIYLEHRMERLAECLGPVTGLKDCIRYMIDLLQNCVSGYYSFIKNEFLKGKQHGDENDGKRTMLEIKSFIEFVQERFTSFASPLKRNLVSEELEDLFKSKPLQDDVVKSCLSLLKTLQTSLEGLAIPCFSNTYAIKQFFLKELLVYFARPQVPTS
nr:hypothetical protein [Tanacetum cinerariifolium]